MLLFIIVLDFIFGYIFTKYYKKDNVIVSNIVKWSFNSSNETSIVNLSNEKIAPGSSGKFEIEIDAMGAEVPVDYEIVVINEKNIPTNIKFYAEIKDAFETILDKTEEYNSFSNLASEKLHGKIETEENNQIRRIVIYWYWNFNQNDNTSIDNNDAILAILR